MVVSMLPSALRLSEGSELRAPMAVVVIGGLVTSTLLTLVFIPAVYTIVDDVQGLFRRIFGRPGSGEGNLERTPFVETLDPVSP
jgi:HAE1 family hydrophobic/amphiphilic exporter-1